MAELPETERLAPLYVSVGEAAKLIGVCPSTLRAWERQGLIIPDRSPSGYRRYTFADIEHLTRMQRSRKRTRRLGVASNEAGPAEHDEAKGREQQHAASIVPWGRRLREQRQQRDLSLRQVATLTGLSASFISGIERGLANPSVAALQKLTAAYSVSIVDLMETGGARGRLVRVADRQRYDAAAGVIMDQLNFGHHLMELHLFTVEPGAGTGGAFHHEGEEFIMMLEGTLHVSIDSLEQYLLHPGDVLYFESVHRHEWINPGAVPAVFLGVNTPRTF